MFKVEEPSVFLSIACRWEPQITGPRRMFDIQWQIKLYICLIWMWVILMCKLWLSLTSSLTMCVRRSRVCSNWNLHWCWNYFCDYCSCQFECCLMWRLKLFQLGLYGMRSNLELLRNQLRVHELLINKLNWYECSISTFKMKRVQLVPSNFEFIL